MKIIRGLISSNNADSQIKERYPGVALYPGEKSVLLDENKTESSWPKETDAGCRDIERCSYVEGNGGSNSRLSYRKLGYRTQRDGGG